MYLEGILKVLWIPKTSLSYNHRGIPFFYDILFYQNISIFVLGALVLFRKKKFKNIFFRDLFVLEYLLFPGNPLYTLSFRRCLFFLGLLLLIKCSFFRDSIYFFIESLFLWRVPFLLECASFNFKGKRYFFSFFGYFCLGNIFFEAFFIFLKMISENFFF